MAFFVSPHTKLPKAWKAPTGDTNNAGVPVFGSYGDKSIYFYQPSFGLGYLSTDTNPPSTIDPPYTFSCWVKLVDANATSGIFGMGSNTGSANAGIILGSGSFKAITQIQSGTSYTANTSTSLSAGVWYHVCAVFTSNSKREIYLNGVSENINTDIITINSTNINKVLIGHRANNATGTAESFNGYISDCRYYNTALSDIAVSELAIGMDQQDNLELWWKMTSGIPGNTVSGVPEEFDTFGMTMHAAHTPGEWPTSSDDGPAD